MFIIGCFCLVVSTGLSKAANMPVLVVCCFVSETGIEEFSVCASSCDDPVRLTLHYIIKKL